MANEQPTTPAQPGEGALDDPTTPVAPQLAAVLMRRSAMVAHGRNDRLDPAPDQPGSQAVAVVGTIRNQPIGVAAGRARVMRTLHRDRLEGRFEELRLVRGSRVQVNSQRSTRAIGQYHPLRSLAALGLADPSAPFFAGAKLASTKHSSQRSFWRSFSSARNARHSASSVPSSSHWRRRRQQVVELPYLPGSARHGAPVHRIHRIPSKHWRSSAGGRPPRGLRLRRGRCGAIRAHWASLNRPLNAMAHLPVRGHGVKLPRVAGF